MTRRCRDCVHVGRNIDGTAWEDIDTGQGLCHHEGSSDDVDLDVIRDSEDCNAFAEYTKHTPRYTGAPMVDVDEERHIMKPKNCPYTEESYKDITICFMDCDSNKTCPKYHLNLKKQ